MDDSSDSDRGASALPKRKPIATTSTPLSPNRSLTPSAFVAATVLAAALFSWPLRWIAAGAPLLVYTILLGQSNGVRILPFVPLWSLLATLNLLYAVASTSWLLYWVFAALCWPSIPIACLFQFDAAARLARRTFRSFLRDLQFTNDKIALFNLPALEIDTGVQGLMVIRGITLSLSTLTVIAHGVEVAVQLSDDMELAIQTEQVVVSLLRNIDIDHVYANFKGGASQMTFGTLVPDTPDPAGKPMIVTNTPILRAASAALDGTFLDPVKTDHAEATHETPRDSEDPTTTLSSVTKLSPTEAHAREKYQEALKHITETSTPNVARKILEAAQQDEATDPPAVKGGNDIRAAICAHIHDQPSIPHPPSQSIKVSTLAHSSWPWLKMTLHRLPLLLRLLLSPLSYFHPINVKSVTTAGSGKWMVELIQQHLFKHYTSRDAEIRRIESRISAWLGDANFAVELGDITCAAHVPINTTYDIECRSKVGDLMAYRMLPGAVDLKQVIRLGGGDATATVPSFLLPHHEHILPEAPTTRAEMELEQALHDADGTPKAVQAANALEQFRKDETNIKISAHAHLPAIFHQDLLNFVAALLKATRVIETEKVSEEIESTRELKRSETQQLADTLAQERAENERRGFKVFMGKVDRGLKNMGDDVKDGMRKAGVNTVNAMANDRWIAKLVGKITRKLEVVQGDVGYSGNIPIALEEYRRRAEPESKILP